MHTTKCTWRKEKSQLYTLVLWKIKKDSAKFFACLTTTGRRKSCLSVLQESIQWSQRRHERRNATLNKRETGQKRVEPFTHFKSCSVNTKSQTKKLGNTNYIHSKISYIPLGSSFPQLPVGLCLTPSLMPLPCMQILSIRSRDGGEGNHGTQHSNIHEDFYIFVSAEWHATPRIYWVAGWRRREW